mmetsp:Transcript_22958/g.68345  ORF Transcript_22958/g.68345 Transcript_22958/m.68345 type:complete len:265 (+) Transcript_22958:88-882(+)
MYKRAARADAAPATSLPLCGLVCTRGRPKKRSGAATATSQRSHTHTCRPSAACSVRHRQLAAVAHARRHLERVRAAVAAGEVVSLAGRCVLRQRERLRVATCGRSHRRHRFLHRRGGGRLVGACGRLLRRRRGRLVGVGDVGRRAEPGREGRRRGPGARRRRRHAVDRGGGRHRSWQRVDRRRRRRVQGLRWRGHAVLHVRVPLLLQLLQLLLLPLLLQLLLLLLPLPLLLQLRRAVLIAHAGGGGGTSRSAHGGPKANSALLT